MGSEIDLEDFESLGTFEFQGNDAPTNIQCTIKESMSQELQSTFLDVAKIVFDTAIFSISRSSPFMFLKFLKIDDSCKTENGAMVDYTLKMLHDVDRSSLSQANVINFRLRH
jgi:hypothetical protein